MSGLLILGIYISQVLLPGEGTQVVHENHKLDIDESGDVIFTSPGYDVGRYPDSVYCTWEISAAANHKIEILFEEFDVEYHPTCRWDNVTIHNNRCPTQSENEAVRLCGIKTNYKYESENNVVCVAFVSDRMVQGKGFRAVAIPLPDPALHFSTGTSIFSSSPSVTATSSKKSTVISSDSVITSTPSVSPSITKSYVTLNSLPFISASSIKSSYLQEIQPSTSLSSKIDSVLSSKKVSGFTVISPTFTSSSLILPSTTSTIFASMSSPTTPKSSLQSDELFPTPSSTLILTGSVLESESEISSETITAESIHSVSKSSTASPNTVVSHSTSSPETTSQPVSVVEITLEGTKELSVLGNMVVIIRTPKDRTGRYPKDMHAELKVINTQKQEMTVEFSTFKLEYHPFCSWDYVIIGTNGKFCGRATPNPINTKSSELNIVFHSDFIVPMEGFVMQLTTHIAATSPLPATVSSAVTSRSSAESSSSSYVSSSSATSIKAEPSKSPISLSTSKTAEHIISSTVGATSSTELIQSSKSFTESSSMLKSSLPTIASLATIASVTSHTGTHFTLSGSLEPQTSFQSATSLTAVTTLESKESFTTPSQVYQTKIVSQVKSLDTATHSIAPTTSVSSDKSTILTEMPSPSMTYSDSTSMSSYSTSTPITPTATSASVSSFSKSNEPSSSFSKSPSVTYGPLTTTATSTKKESTVPQKSSDVITVYDICETNQVFLNDRITLVSPGFLDNEDYPLDIECTIQFAAPENSEISVTFEEFNVEMQSTCSWDSVQFIFNQSNLRVCDSLDQSAKMFNCLIGLPFVYDYKIGKKKCLSNTGRTFVLNGVNRLNVTFISDHYVRKSGFNLTISIGYFGHTAPIGSYHTEGIPKTTGKPSVQNPQQTEESDFPAILGNTNGNETMETTTPMVTTETSSTDGPHITEDSSQTIKTTSFQSLTPTTSETLSASLTTTTTITNVLSQLVFSSPPPSSSSTSSSSKSSPSSTPQSSTASPSSSSTKSSQSSTPQSSTALPSTTSASSSTTTTSTHITDMSTGPSVSSSGKTTKPSSSHLLPTTLSPESVSTLQLPKPEQSSTACDGSPASLFDESGYIECPVFSTLSQHHQTLTCSWVIKEEKQKVITLFFEKFDLNCQDDVLTVAEIRKHPQETSTLALCSSLPTVLASPYDVIITFTSNRIQQGRGFKLKYYKTETNIQTPVTSCLPGRSPCWISGGCVPSEWICDGEPDCPNQEDENGCPSCAANELQCHDDTCVPVTSRCDGIVDCSFGEDETDCVFQNETAGGAVVVSSEGSLYPLCYKDTQNGDAVCNVLGYRLHDSMWPVEPEVDGAVVLNIKPGNNLTLTGISGNECPTQKGTGLRCSGEECGLRDDVHRRKRIVGGSLSASGDWPWSVALRSGTSVVCGASIINELWLITAAHCVRDMVEVPHVASIVAGVSDVNDVSGQIRHVAEVVVHPDNHFIYNADIALLRLTRPLVLNDNVKRICLPWDNRNFTPKSRCYVAGWGVSDMQHYYTTIAPRFMRHVKTKIVLHEHCRDMYAHRSDILDTMICAGYVSGGMDACRGDSGGALACERGDGRWSLAGVVSWGEMCGSTNKPGVYTKVTPFLSWINHTIGQQGLGHVNCTFETSDWCGYTDVSNDTYIWTRKPASPQGSDFILYAIRAGYGRKKPADAVILSPSFTSVGNSCLTFSHMFSGNSKLTMSVYGLTDNQDNNEETLLWRITSNYPAKNKWVSTETEIPAGTSRLKFVSFHGNGDISGLGIDNVVLMPTKCTGSAYLLCNFNEGHTCSYTQLQERNGWKIKHKGKTKADYYIQGGGNFENFGFNAISQLLSPVLSYKFTTVPHCLRFSYNKNEPSSSQLIVATYVAMNEFLANQQIFWSSEDAIIGQWTNVSVDVLNGYYNYIVFEIRRSSFTTEKIDIMVDDISIHDGNCV